MSNIITSSPIDLHSDGAQVVYNRDYIRENFAGAEIRTHDLPTMTFFATAKYYRLRLFWPPSGLNTVGPSPAASFSWDLEVVAGIWPWI